MAGKLRQQSHRWPAKPFEHTARRNGCGTGL